MNMVWIKSTMSWIPEDERTMGVRIVDGGEVQCLYYEPFVESIAIEELYTVVQHEIEHIVRCHCVRVSNRDPEAWNLAADMCVNGPENNPRIGYISNNRPIFPLNPVWIPKGWDTDCTVEDYYDKLVNGATTDGKAIDNHSTWSQTDVSIDEVRQIVKNLVEDASSKCNGYIPGHLSELIAGLSKPLIRWRDLLKRYVGRHAGSSRRTYSRANRRRQEFGTKGKSRHASSDVNVIIDTSGSISNDDLEQFFTEIESICSGYRVWILQWDRQFAGYSKYRRGDWRKFSINGRGGTDMAKPIEWLCDNGHVKDVQIMLTDGYCNYTSDKNFPYICVITTDQPGPDWGYVVRM
jgi:predicted metal-dependent peptidase